MTVRIRAFGVEELSCFDFSRLLFLSLPVLDSRVVVLVSFDVSLLGL